MPRLSLYRPNKSNDYKFLDKTIKEMFTVGATDLYIHKYLGANNQGTGQDFTKPVYDKLDPTNIQDLLFLENRDRKYDPNIYCLRGHYNVQNLDFDLSQFGLFLNNDIIFITVHYNNMIETVGRKLMVGDVFELPHLTDYHPLNEAIPVGLRRYYQITDANFASEGFSQTWMPHLWRIKCEPLVDSQEFSNILSAPVNKDNYLGDWDSSKTYVPGYTVTYGDKTYTPISEVPAGVPCTDTTYWELDTADNLRDIIGRYNKNLAINDAAIAEAARLVPKNGYDRSQLYLVPTTNGKPQQPINIITSKGAPIVGSVAFVAAAGYTPSPVIRIGAAARKQMLELTSSDADALSKFLKLSLETARLAPERTSSGSGQVEGDLVLAATSLGVVDGPYGTSDNTYAFADQFPTITLTISEDSKTNDTVLKVVDVVPDEVPDTWYRNPGIDIASYILNSQQQQVVVFPPNTKIISVDPINNTVTLNNPTLTGIAAGSTIIVGSNFTGEIIPNVMNYRADTDPRFQFIARYTPESFGYTDGYMAGDGTAPNGLPTGAGIVFPSNPAIGSYFLRTDYLPQQLFRWDGSLWIKISENVRASTSTSSDQTQMGSFINNNNVTTLTDGTTIPEQQSLSSILKIIAD